MLGWSRANRHLLKLPNGADSQELGHRLRLRCGQRTRLVDKGNRPKPSPHPATACGREVEDATTG